LPPATGLNDPDIANPIALLSSAVDSVRYLVKATDTKGCYGTDDIVVYVYKTAPEIFVPSAFTPNGDGKNDVIRPVTVGITQLEYFRIYNRWGQLLYSTGEVGQGWDGTLNGTRQPSGTYVYMARGTDYRGNAVSRKGTVVLIR
jgi:gliding motility-associated-like protein